jgi:serine/threonine protein kinase
MTRDPRVEIYGPFDVLEQLGVGGMATVHRAIERGPDGFEREVALKRPLAHLAEDDGFLAAFVHEARLAALLDHPSIVRQYELGRVGPSLFISMEYIPGRDVRAIVRQARMVGAPPPVEIVLALFGELLDALDHAHNLRGAALDAGDRRRGRAQSRQQRTPPARCEVVAPQPWSMPKAMVVWPGQTPSRQTPRPPQSAPQQTVSEHQPLSKQS